MQKNDQVSWFTNCCVHIALKVKVSSFSNFSCRFLNHNYFFQFNLKYYISRKKAFFFKNCSDWYCLNKLFQRSQKFRKLLSSASKIFQSLEHFFLPVGQNNFGNKITVPIRIQVTEVYQCTWKFIDFHRASYFAFQIYWSFRFSSPAQST